MLDFILQNFFFLFILIVIGVFMIRRFTRNTSESSMLKDKDHIESLKRRVEELERKK